MWILALFVALLTLVTAILVFTKIEESFIFFVLGIFLLSISLVFFIGMFTNINDLGYKQGQIDCINGSIKYQLKENPDKTKEWVEIKQ